MYRLATLEELHEQRHSLGLYCVNCDRWSIADLLAIIELGLGSRQITRTRFSCADCGMAAEKQIRPPVPQVGGAVAYIAAPVRT